jgi:hypothetical protein
MAECKDIGIVTTSKSTSLGVAGLSATTDTLVTTKTDFPLPGRCPTSRCCRIKRRRHSDSRNEAIKASLTARAGNRSPF